MDFTEEQQAWADHIFALLDKLSDLKADLDLHLSKALEIKKELSIQWKEYYNTKDEIEQLERQLRSYKNKKPECPSAPKKRKPNPK